MSEDRLRAWMEANRLNWDDRTAVHLRNRTGFYPIDRVRAADNALGEPEDAELGDVARKRLVHLQCHFGLDSIRLARRGAIVTGLDFSASAIAAARALAAELGVPAHFVEGNVYDAPALLHAQYDIAFVTWGSIIWLPDIRLWAQIVAELLAPGGWLYLAEGHPSTLSLDEVDGRLVALRSWRTPAAGPFIYDETTTYTGDPTPLAHTRSYEWCHPLSDIIGGLLEAGMHLDFLHEHERLPWRYFPMMVEAEDWGYRLPDGHPPWPLAFSVRASKRVSAELSASSASRR
ncbi:MAG TPA: class I SAM-dependent methyltransferase [Stellaceae bacterium]|nr:class I SAM-dependent methyltransferase [Stellaceae bacterium]HMD64107.1 class I SAM-dependent methyltransferase [Stellaceae bacterium]